MTSKKDYQICASCGYSSKMWHGKLSCSEINEDVKPDYGCSRWEWGQPVLCPFCGGTELLESKRDMGEYDIPEFMCARCVGVFQVIDWV